MTIQSLTSDHHLIANLPQNNPSTIDQAWLSIHFELRDKTSIRSFRDSFDHPTQWSKSADW